MLKKKRQTDSPLLVTAMIVLVMVANVIVACQNEYHLYQRHFKIEEIHMTRVSIDSFPADPAVMYLIESALSDCPPETIKSDGKARGYPPYAGGSIDTILSVEFTHNGTPVIPTQLHWHNCYEIMIASKGIRIDTTQVNWQNCADTLDAGMYLYNMKDNINSFFTTNKADYKNLPALMMCPNEFNDCSFDKNYFSLCYLVCFDKDSPLPDASIVRCKNREIKVKVDNNPVKLKLNGHIHHYGPVK